MAEPHTEVVVAVIPSCDICLSFQRDRAAYADARLPTGPWAYVCQEHFNQYNCQLGIGRGQRLIAEGGSR
jgi:hypothetical protein